MHSIHTIELLLLKYPSGQEDKHVLFALNKYPDLHFVHLDDISLH